ncbi:MAG: T6SS immunity protein Tdi1 domain-containing protein [Sphingomonas sp.]|jgi:hypothetical protein|uniref:T6SS immunity protein Tdi1 domain-containing protein n=1 Tax=Sphingomonas sp. TaxID=28214 RepID=UPI003565E75C
MLSKAARNFLSAYKPDEAYRPFTAKDRKRLGRRIPKVMREILERDGWASYNDQTIWSCDPDDWEEAARPWLPDDAKACDVLLRSSFGDLIAWDGDRFWLVMPHDQARIGQTSDPDWLFSSTLRQDDFHFNDELPGETTAAREKCGPLKWNEMYNFAPALALGGKRSDAEIAKEDARVALSLLSQMAPIQSVDA